MSAALDILWGGTGNRAVGAEPFTTLTPTWLAAKGFGFLPESMKFLRPFGVTTQLGYLFPTESSTTAFDEGSGSSTSLRWVAPVQHALSQIESAGSGFA